MTKFEKLKVAKYGLVFLGTIVWSLTMVKSGLIYSFGMGFWGPNGHDGVWHISLINHLAKGSFNMPVFAGEALKNYHIGFDFFLAIVKRITGIAAQTLYFQILPPIVAAAVGLLTYKFVLLWRKSKREAFFSTFFVYFGGSFGYLVTLLRSGDIGGESMFWSQQAISTLINPPFAVSLVLILLGLILLLRYKKERTNKLLFLTSLVFGLLIQIKVYAGLLVLGGLLVSGVWEKLKERKEFTLKVFVLSLIISLLIFLPFLKDSTNLVVFKPFWFLETMMGLPDRFYWSKFGEAMVNYKLGGVWIKAILAYTLAFFVFWYGNMGTRLIQEKAFANWIVKKKFSNIKVFLISVILAGTVLPLFFLQKGTPWNTIQFFYYSLFFSGIIAGVVLAEWLTKPSLSKKILASLVVLFTIPTTIGTLRHYLPKRPPAKISLVELEALEFLSKKPHGVVLTYPFDRNKAEAAKDNPPRPLYLYESTAYVAAFSEKEVYLEDEVNLDITRYDWQARKDKVLKFIKEGEREFLDENKIGYIYLTSGQSLPDVDRLGISKIFENSEVIIYKVE